MIANEGVNEMPGTVDHQPEPTTWKVVTANAREVIVVTMCTCGSDYCSWTASAGFRDFVNQREDGSSH
jgi:hypothetical protein